MESKAFIDLRELSEFLHFRNFFVKYSTVQVHLDSATVRHITVNLFHIKILAALFMNLRIYKTLTPIPF